MRFRHVFAPALVAAATLVLPPAPPADAGTLPLSGVVAMDSGAFSTCIVSSAGTVSCWGGNSWGNIHDDLVSRSVPTMVAGVSGAVDVVVGSSLACALLDDATVSCWGTQFEPVPFGLALHSVDPDPVEGLAGVVDLAIAGDVVCAVLTGGSVKCWGGNDAGETGQPLATLWVPTPTTVPGLDGVVRIAGGTGVFCAIRTDQTARCWGRNDNGRLGHNASGEADPVPTSPVGLTGVLDIDISQSHTCAVVQVASDEHVKCWGSDFGRELGTAVAGDTTQPTTAVAGITDAVQVTVGYYVSCALRATGAVVCWGPNSEGQLGRGNTGDSTPTPAAVVGVSGVDSVSAMTRAACALADGVVECWGSNFEGRLGRGDNVERYLIASPVVLGVAEYVPVTPARLLDTRAAGSTVDGLFEKGGLVAANAVVELTVAGRGGVLGTAKAATLNVTSIGAAAQGYVTVWPCDQSKPNASSLNVLAGVTRANLVMVKVPSSGPKVGKVCLSPSVAMHLVADVGGYYPFLSPYVGVQPARLVDTRPTGVTVDGSHQQGGTLVPGVPTYFQISGRGGLPNPVGAAVLNVTAVNPAATGYVTVYPCGGDAPNASNLNLTAGVNVANLVVTKLDGGGGICVVASVSTHLIVDVTGYMPTAMDYEAMMPARLADTRPAGATVDGQFVGAGPVTSIPGLPITRGPVRVARTVVLNVTAVNPAAAGYLTVYACNVSGPPLASNLNFAAGVTTPNAVVVNVGRFDDICIVSSTPTHVIVDVQGLFAY